MNLRARWWMALPAAAVAALYVAAPALAERQRPLVAALRVGPELKRDLKEDGLRFGDPIFIRIFKEERELELWVQEPGKPTFRHFRTWPIAGMSGKLEPKLAEGDFQAPEGFYHVDRSALNPRSAYHLSFNLGFPNAYDRARGRSGSFLMVHGGTMSIGCFAMTDPVIEEIYTLAEAALKNGQKRFAVHAFPFRFSDARMAKEEDHRWIDFWRNLREGYLFFETTRIPPEVTVENQRYVFAESEN